MTSILGYDIDGRPLRAGDRVVVAVVLTGVAIEWQALLGAQLTVTENDSVYFDQVNFEELDDRYCSPTKYLRKQEVDHKPASESFQDIMRKYGSKQGVGA